MAYTFEITDGIESIGLVYDVGVQEQYKVMYGASIQPSEPLAVWHDSNESSQQLSDLIDQNRTAFFKLRIKQDETMDDVLNAIAKLRRWIGGATQQAARYWIHNDVNRISLKVKRDGATNATLHPVIYGVINDGGAHYKAVDVLNDMATDVVVQLTLAPYGEAETAVSLKNAIKNGAFSFEGATSGLAAFWTKQATPTTTLDNSVYLTGGQSQKVVAASSGNGIQSNSVSDTVTSGGGYAWVYVTSGDVTIQLRDTTAGVNQGSAVLDNTDSGDVSDKSVIDSSGNTWYRVSVSSSGLTSGNNHNIRITTSGGAATFYAGLAYLKLGTTTIPDCWASQALIYNRGDQTTTNPEHINYIDVWGVAGDVDAVVNHTIDSTLTSSNGELFMLSAWQDRSDMLAVNFEHWAEAEDMTATDGGGTWALVTNANAAGESTNNVQRLTAPGGGAGNGTLTYTMPYARVPCKVFIRAKASNSASTINLAQTAAGDATPIIQKQTITLSTSWADYEIGLAFLDKPRGSGEDGGKFNLFVLASAASVTVDIDRFMFVPLSGDGHLALETNLTTPGVMGATDMTVSGEEERAWLTREAVALGTYSTIRSGQHMTRLFYNIYESAPGNNHYLGDIFDVALSVLPRTRHMLSSI
ncbi:MAG: hypothetical protein GY938_16645 [Ketobacter sp.]|nr:hypothetical protein [Ketobacter sp.]